MTYLIPSAFEGRYDWETIQNDMGAVMGCNVLRTICLDDGQEFRICADRGGTLRLELVGAGSGCAASANLAEARLDASTGRYAVIEHDVYVQAIDDILDDYLRGECADRDAAVQMLADILH